MKAFLLLPICVFAFLVTDTAKSQVKIHKIEKHTLDHCPVLPLSGWEHHTEPVLKGFLHAYQPCVVETNDKQYPYRMWFFGWASEICNPGYPGCDAIYFARSKNLDSWEVYCKDGSWDTKENKEKWQAVLYSSVNESKNYYDTWHTGDPSVVLKDGIYYMAYSATSKPLPEKLAGYPSGMMLCVMGATSTDGINWKKAEKPLLIAKCDSVFPPMANENRVGDFHRPSLLWNQEKNKWELYFDYYNAKIAGNFHMGLATNAGDFMAGEFNIVSDLNKPLMLDWPNPEVVKIGSCYYSFSDPSGYLPSNRTKQDGDGWRDRQLRIAKSNDGLLWEKQYFIPSDPGIGASQIPQTLVCKREGKWWLYLFFATQVGSRKTEINYPSFFNGKYNWFYDQIRYMRQEIK